MLQIRSFRKANWLAYQIIKFFLLESRLKMQKMYIFFTEEQFRKKYSISHIILPTCFAIFYVLIFEATMHI